MLAVFTIVDEFVRQTVIVPEFANLERASAVKDTARVISAIRSEVDSIAKTAERDRDILRAFLGQGEFEELPKLPVREHVNHAGIWRSNGDYRSLTENPALPEELIDILHTSLQGEQDGRDRGIAGVNGQAFLFASAPLETTDDEARYVVIRRFDDRLIADLQQRTSIHFGLDLVDSARSVPEIDDRSASELLVRAPLRSLGGSHCELTIEVPREVIMRSSVTNGIARYLSLCGSLASLVMLLLLLQWIVIGRIEAIREHTDRIAQTGILAGDSTPALGDTGRDEIGQLAKAFDRMKGRLADAQRRMSDSSHAAGMSLVADTVIHNVGNVLTNVNSLLETATNRVEGLRIQPLNKLAERLNRDEIDEAFQKATPGYLHRLSESLGNDRDELALLLETLYSNVQHIHQVIRDQKRHAQQSPKPVDVLIKPLIEEAVRCCQARLDQDRIRVELDGDSDAKALTDQLLLLQIMINLIGNARNAMRGVKPQRSKLEIRWRIKGQEIEIQFRDNGCGMDSATLERVFDAHFTTRESGSGLGLHFCAIALRRIGGSIRALSEGPQLGATFVITLPTDESMQEADYASSATTSESRS
ncbi:MAG: ATP-binding protein [Planctomycetota bacterium]